MVTSTDEIMAKHCWTKIPVTRCSLRLFTCLIYKTDLIEYTLCFSSQLNVLSLENSVLTLYFKFNAETASLKTSHVPMFIKK